MGAIAAAVALHAGVLILRPDVSGGRASATTTSVLAVRMVYPAEINWTSPIAKSPAPPFVAPASVQEPSAAPPPRARTALAPGGPQERKDERKAPGSQLRDAATSTSSVLDPAQDYALGANLDPGPRSLDEIDPDYPDPVKLRSGTVVLRLLISDTGHVDDVAVVRAEPLGVFEQAAIEAFSKARFSPGMAGGMPVKSQIRVEVEFMPINRGARISGRNY